MTNTEIVVTCVVFGILVFLGCCAIAYGLCKAAGREVPHPENSCNGGLTDEEMEDMK